MMSVNRKELCIEYNSVEGFLEKAIYFRTLDDLEAYINKPDKKLIKYIKNY